MDFSKNDLSKAQKGDEIWNYFAQVWETVENIEFGDGLPIKIEGGNECDFSGRETRDDVGPTYFWNEIHFDIPERPKRRVKKEIQIWLQFGNDGTFRGTTEIETFAKEWIREGRHVEMFSTEIEIEE